MNVNFKFNDAEQNEKIYFESVQQEKQGGGIVANPTFHVLPSTALGLVGDKYVAIKAYRTTESATAEDTTIKIAKGSGVTTDDFIAYGKKSAKVTAVDTTHTDYDVVSVALGVVVPKDAVLYEAQSASTNAQPKHTPVAVCGAHVEANEGDALVKIVYGAVLRKETANIASEVAALLPTIKLV